MGTPGLRVAAILVSAAILSCATWSYDLIPGTVVAAGIGFTNLAQDRASLYFVNGSRRVSRTKLEDVPALYALVLMPANNCILYKFSHASERFEAAIRDGYSSI